MRARSGARIVAQKRLSMEAWRHLILSAQSRLDGLEIPDNGLDSRPNGFFAETVAPLESVAPHGHFEAAVRLEVTIATVNHPLNSLGNESPISRFRKLCQVGRPSPEDLRDRTIATTGFPMAA